MFATCSFIVAKVLLIIASLVCPSKTFRYGKGCVIRYTFFECKWLCSIYLHCIKTETQDRFHTHAFNALAFILTGGYKEAQKDGIGRDASVTEHSFVAPTVRYIPRLLNHQLLQAQPDTITVLVTSPWSHLWTEETVDGSHVRLLTHGYREVMRW